MRLSNLADNVTRALGNASVVINNAGVALSQNVETMNRQDFEWVLNINFGRGEWL